MSLQEDALQLYVRGPLMYMPHATLPSQPSLSPSQVADLRLAASKMTGPTRRAFEAEMTLKYYGGTPLMAEVVFGWGRQTVALGLAERRTGILCLGAQSAFSGRKRWEERHPQVAESASSARRCACATRPDVSHERNLHAADCPGGPEGAERAGL